MKQKQGIKADYFLTFLGDENGELLARFCGQTAPGVPIVVSTPQLWVHFLTDQATVDLGFQATYYFSGKLPMYECFSFEILTRNL